MMAGDESHAAHVGRQRVDFVDAARGLQAVVPAAQVEQLEFVGVRRAVFRALEVDAAHPVAVALQVRDQVMADEAARSGHQRLWYCPVMTSVSARLHLSLERRLARGSVAMASPVRPQAQA